MPDIAIHGLAEKSRVVVAMSGGVDSSVTAAILADRGYDVVGVTLQLYDHGAAIARANTCCAGRDIHDARRVADSIGIPHYVLSFEELFRAQVMEPFADSYLAGQTPIPCVECNRTVKFHDLLDHARELGAEALVTGHYARRVEGASGPELHRGQDPARDQSYFLFTTTKEQLAFLQFPLGGLDKDETRELARGFSLGVAEKADSQDICFVPEGRYQDVVEKLRPGAHRAGEIVDQDGAVLGEHDGILNFTVGQRRGLGIAAPHPLYVLRIDAENARVTVGPKEALLKKRFTLHTVNWLGDGDGLPADGIALEVKVRSTTPPVKAMVKPLVSGRAEVALDEPQGGISPGQACVFYLGERMLGGGWIEKEPS